MTAGSSARMPATPEQIAAYEKALYVVFGRPELVIRIGEPNPGPGRAARSRRRDDRGVHHRREPARRTDERLEERDRQRRPGRDADAGGISLLRGRGARPAGALET